MGLTTLATRGSALTTLATRGADPLTTLATLFLKVVSTLANASQDRARGIWRVGIPAGRGMTVAGLVGGTTSPQLGPTSGGTRHIFTFSYSRFGELFFPPPPRFREAARSPMGRARARWLFLFDHFS